MTPSTSLLDPPSETPTLLRCTTAADFLAALPYFVGFVPRNSIIIVLFSGARTRRAMRLDLPVDATPEVAASLLEAVCDLLQEVGAAGDPPAIVLATDRSFAEESGAPWRGFARMIRRRFARNGWELRELAVIAADGWAELLNPSRRGVRRPLGEIGASPVAALAHEVEASPASIEDLGRLPAARRARAASLAARLSELDARAQGSGRLGDDERRSSERVARDPLAWVRGVARVVGACLSSSDSAVEPRLGARLVRATETPESWLVVALTALTRPAFVISVADDGTLLHFLTAAGLQPLSPDGKSQTRAELADRMHTLLTSLALEPPDIKKLRRAIEVFSEIAAHTPVPRRAGLLALIAWLWWECGMQSVCARLIEEAKAIDLDHPLVTLVERLNQQVPQWPLAKPQS